MKNVLHVKVVEPMADLLDRARGAMESLDAGVIPEPYFGIGFESFPQLLEVFSLGRWALLTHLSAQGPLTLADLARGLGRDEAEVVGDVAVLLDWTVLERQADGRVWVPWDEVDLRLPLARQAA
jgi:predicted transcriptional regulator